MSKRCKTKEFFNHLQYRIELYCLVLDKIYDNIPIDNVNLEAVKVSTDLLLGVEIDLLFGASGFSFFQAAIIRFAKKM